MKKLFPLFLILGLGSISFLSYSFIASPDEVNQEKITTDIAKDIEWMSWEEAIAANKKNPKKIFIDVYTEWCGWCKRMDSSTFKDKAIVAYMNENFYAVKMDAEMKQDVVFNDHTFKFVNSGRRGYHELAAALLENKMSYPSFVAMDEKINRITIIPGYRDTAGLLPILEYVKKESYKTMSFAEYEKSMKK